jgi:positive regulator of sigma E activity
MTFGPVQGHNFAQKRESTIIRGNLSNSKMIVQFLVFLFILLSVYSLSSFSKVKRTTYHSRAKLCGNKMCQT